MPFEQTRWMRIEPRSRDRTLAPGLEARVHDPLWLLGRQWQFGELTADRAVGSPILAQITAEIAPITGLRPGRRDGTAATVAYDASALPLEAVVEAEDVREGPTARARARAGQHFERLLAAHGVGRYARAFREAYPLREEPADDAGRRFVAILAGRVVDGHALYADLAAALRPARGAPRLPPAPAIEPGDVDAVRIVGEDWLAWADALVLSPAHRNPAWVDDRMEYAFSGGVPAGEGVPASLVADEYASGDLDWHSFSADATALGAPGRVEAVGPVTVVPSPVTYPGMPASRLWEFEDARVDFGGVDAEPEDIGRLLLAEFALVYGGDWLVVPLEVPAGGLVRIVSFTVRDTFGRVVAVPPISSRGESDGWRLFGLSAAGPSASRERPGDALLVAPALASSLHGRAVEEVVLARDETANLAWAIERSIEGADGAPLDRASLAYRGGATAARPSAADTLLYRLRTDVPSHWLPLVPRRLRPDDPSTTFRLGALARVAVDGRVEPIRPRGRLLAPATPGAEVLLREEEVPREGARVVRAYRYARWYDGTTVLWMGRRKSVGRGEGSSGLRFDAADPAP